MLDLSDIPRPQGADVQVFYGISPSLGASWSTWQKPRGCTFISIFCLGGGGSGSAGTNGSSTTTTGGGGGGSGAQSSMLFFANDLPDTLYVSVGKGAARPLTGIGSIGAPTVVSLLPDTTSNFLLCVVNGGGAGSLITQGTGGAASTISTNPLAGLGFPSYGLASSANTSVAGINGGKGNQRLTTTATAGTGTVATLTFSTTGTVQYAVGDTITVANVTPTGYNGTFTVTACTATTVSYANITTAAQTVAGTIVGPSTPISISVTGCVTTGGGGGGAGGPSSLAPGINGTDSRFFPVSTTLSSLAIIPGGIGSIGNGTNGGNGVKVSGSLIFLGGAGGGGAATAIGGNGGDGAYGCGGGGGGGTFSSVTVGAGGAGGDGLCIITAW